MESFNPNKLKRVFKRFELDWYDSTPCLDAGIDDRSSEILSWLSKNKCDNFAILDDDLDAEVEGHFFKTNYNIGLTEEITQKVIEFLNKKL